MVEFLKVKSPFLGVMCIPTVAIATKKVTIVLQYLKKLQYLKNIFTILQYFTNISNITFTTFTNKPYNH